MCCLTQLRLGAGSLGIAVVSSALALLSLATSVSADRTGGGRTEGKGSGGLPVQTTILDYFQHGTQPEGAGVPGGLDEMQSAMNCYFCHANYGPTDPYDMVEPFGNWAASMMAQSARDPLFHAALTIANQTMPEVGTYCIRCHAPTAFLRGHAAPADASAFEGADWEGVNCNFCHRMVDPVHVPGQSPSQDAQILADLAAANLMPPQGSNARYIIDPTDTRRGPFDDIPLNIHPGDPQPEIVHSRFHTKSEMCWTCHDVSNPLMTKVGNSYVLNDLNTPHPTGEQTQMMPLHRTYSEWKNSYYSNLGVLHADGRFGGNHPDGWLFECQDCHMPDTIGYGSNYEFEPFFERPNVPQHSFMGSNYWVLNAIRTVDFDGDGEPDFPDSESQLSDMAVAAAIERNIDFLQKASDLEVVRINDNIRTRLINFTGHKLPTGFPDGRRIWINVKFFDCDQNLIQERGAYDFDTAELTRDTEVYEILLGIDGADYAQSLGLPEGHTFHFMLANKILKDNRIPPAGFANSIATQLQTSSVGAFYPNGQNWDDTLFAIPEGAGKAVVTVNYQLVSKEFIEYLRDENTTDNKGQVVYNLWVQHGMSAPVEIDMMELAIYRPEDVNQDTVVNADDLLAVINGWGPCPPSPTPCPGDVDNDQVINANDLLAVINEWGPCF